MTRPRDASLTDYPGCLDGRGSDGYGGSFMAQNLLCSLKVVLTDGKGLRAMTIVYSVH